MTTKPLPPIDVPLMRMLEEFRMSGVVVARWADQVSPIVLRWAADQLLGDDRIFDSDHDNALVSARLTELADRITAGRINQ